MRLLAVDGINTYYGYAHALFDVSLRVEENEVLALLGRNGAGKSTTLKTIMDVLAPKKSAIRFAGKPIWVLRFTFVKRSARQWTLCSSLHLATRRSRPALHDAF
jgi:branched-chain amino acid transport system ATP-binding protein